MNVFSSDAFLETLAKVHFAGRRCEPAHYRVGDAVYRLLSVDGRPIVDWPFLDFFEPVPPEAASSPAALPLSFLPRAAVGLVPVSVDRPALPQDQQPSPLVDFRQLPTWEALEAHARQRRSKLFADSAKRERKLVAALGPVTFAFDEPTDEAFEQCRVWKSARYIATGGTDAFFRENLELFRELLRRELLVVSTMRAGETLVAVSWSIHTPERFSYWVPAYDPAHAAFSPGRLLLHWSLAETQRRGYREFDFLIGDEEYKWHYATHTRIIAPVGRAPWRLRAQKTLKGQVKKVLARYPQIMEAARRAKRTLAR